MKKIPNPSRFYSSSHLLLGFLAVLLGGGVLLLALLRSKTFAARIGSPQAEPSSQAFSSKNDRVTNSGPTHRLDEQGNRPATEPFVPLPRINLAQSDRMEMELGSRSDRRAATCSMLLFRPLLRVSLSLGSHPRRSGGTLYRSSDGGDIWSEVLALQGQVFSTSSLLTPAQRTSALRTASDEVRTTA